MIRGIDYRRLERLKFTRGSSMTPEECPLDHQILIDEMREKRIPLPECPDCGISLAEWEADRLDRKATVEKRDYYDSRRTKTDREGS